MSTTAATVLAQRLGSVVSLTLNRPKALNALTLEMCKAIKQNLTEWKGTTGPNVPAGTSPVAAMIMKGAGEKAFCAGGDVNLLYEDCVLGGPTLGSGAPGRITSDFFLEEYEMNYILGTSPIPQVSIWNGIVMGGGVGVSVLGDFRIATERTLFAMPETAIGLFPDVGSSAWLPHLHPGVGEYIGLTGVRLGPADLLLAGIATHYIPSSKLPALEAAIVEQFPDRTSADAGTGAGADTSSADTRKVLHSILKSFHEAPPVTPEEIAASGGAKFNVNPNVIRDNVDMITQCFAHKKTIGDIMSALRSASVGTASTIGNAWASKTLETLLKMSPTSLKVTFQQLKRGRELDLRGCLEMEYRLAQGCMRTCDFREGVRAVLVDKDGKPVWKPAELADVTDAYVESFFASLGEHELKLPGEGSGSATSSSNSGTAEGDKSAEGGSEAAR